MGKTQPCVVYTGRAVEGNMLKAANVLERFTSQQYPNTEKENRSKETSWGKCYKNTTKGSRELQMLWKQDGVKRNQCETGILLNII